MKSIRDKVVEEYFCWNETATESRGDPPKHLAIVETGANGEAITACTIEEAWYWDPEDGDEVEENSVWFCITDSTGSSASLFSYKDFPGTHDFNEVTCQYCKQSWPYIEAQIAHDNED